MGKDLRDQIGLISSFLYEKTEMASVNALSQVIQPGAADLELESQYPDL